MAEALLVGGLEVSLVEKSPAICTGTTLSELVQAELEARGVTVLGRAAGRISRADGSVQAVERHEPSKPRTLCSLTLELSPGSNWRPRPVFDSARAERSPCRSARKPT